MLDVGERIGGMAMINNLEFVNKYVECATIREYGKKVCTCME